LDVQALRANACQELSALGNRLAEGSYRFGAYTKFSIRDPKTRVIRAPAFRDRVVHHAMIAVTGPVFERGAIARSYACRKGLGPHRALRQAAAWARSSPAFLKVDVVRFYDSISHARLMAALARRFRERRLLALWKVLLDSYCLVPGRGLPIGALTSQYLGNFTLDLIDHWILEVAGMRRYLRYMDDMLVFGDLAALRTLRRRLVEKLAGLGLEAKHGGILNACALGVPWLGFTLYPDRVRTSRRGRHRLRRRWRTLERERIRGRLAPLALQARASALFAHPRQADDVAWRRTLLDSRAYGEALELDEPRHAGRLLEQQRQEVPLGVPQQEPPWQSQRQPGLPRLLAPWHGGVAADGVEETALAGSPDDASSRAPRAWPPGPPSGTNPAVGPRTGSKSEGCASTMEKTPPEAPPHSSRGLEAGP